VKPSRRIDPSLVRSIFTYAPTTGIMKWRRARGNSVYAYDVAGCMKDGYWQIKIGERFWKRGRLAWAHYYGKNPPREIDYKDRVKTNDRISNLRKGTRAGQPVNAVYRKKVYFDMPRGVRPVKWGYRGKVSCQYRRIERDFHTLEQANAWVQKTGKKVHGKWWPTL